MFANVCSFGSQDRLAEIGTAQRMMLKTVNCEYGLHLFYLCWIVKTYHGIKMKIKMILVPIIEIYFLAHCQLMCRESQQLSSQRASWIHLQGVKVSGWETEWDRNHQDNQLAVGTLIEDYHICQHIDFLMSRNFNLTTAVHKNK